MVKNRDWHQRATGKRIMITTRCCWLMGKRRPDVVREMLGLPWLG
jgi:hypothetical protein